MEAVIFIFGLQKNLEVEVPFVKNKLQRVENVCVFKNSHTALS